MKIQLLTAVTILALSATTAQASRHQGTDINNDSKNALAIGSGSAGGASANVGPYGGGSAEGSYISFDSGRAIAGSVLLEGNACACELNEINNYSKNAIAVGRATAGSVHINTTSSKY